MSNRESGPLTAAQAERPFFVGVDIGGTNIKYGLVDSRGRIIANDSIATETELGPESACQRIGDAVRRMMASQSLTLADVTAIGLGSPGTMDIPKGMLLEPPNLKGWWHFPIRDRVRAACDNIPVSFANDANAAAYGEFWVGTGRVHHSIVLLTLGTGVGGGIIIGDLSIDGENSHGSECGHIIIDFHATARICSCGQGGHLEAYASAVALVKRTEERLAAGAESILRDWIASGKSLTPRLIAEAADEKVNDALALELVLETAMYLGVGITSLMHTIDPGAVILGGAMTFGGAESNLGCLFLERIREEVRRRSFPVLARRTTIEFASLGGDAGFVGAAGIARTHFLNPPSSASTASAPSG